ncbi:MAG: hypothetical protein ACLVLH_21635 [Eisenbergiella massiliensis]
MNSRKIYTGLVVLLLLAALLLSRHIDPKSSGISSICHTIHR